MSFSQPPAHTEQRLKYACEECHSRKIRCYVSQKAQSGTCTPCHANGRKCLFALKNKTGRPRRPTLPQQSKSKSNDSSSTQESDSMSMDWDRRPDRLRRQSENLGYDLSDLSRSSSGRKDQLSMLPERPSYLSPRVPDPSLSMYNGNTARRDEMQHPSPGLLDYDIDYLPESELSKYLYIGPLSNNLSRNSSDNTSQDCFDVNLVPSAPDPALLLSTAQSSNHSSSTSSSYDDPIGDSVYNQAFYISQEIHRRYVSIQPQTMDSTNKYASVEVCETLECFDTLARFLQQRIAGNKQQRSSGGLPAMIVSGIFYVTVLQAILIATILLHTDGEGPRSDKTPNNSIYSGRASSLASDESVSSNIVDKSGIGSLDSILNLTKMEYYITVFIQYLQFHSSTSNTDYTTQASPALFFDYKACIDTTESVQARVRFLLSQSRQAIK